MHVCWEGEGGVNSNERSLFALSQIPNWFRLASLKMQRSFLTEATSSSAMTDPTCSAYRYTVLD